MRSCLWLSLTMLGLAVHTDVQARTVHRCVRDGTVSLATAPEPGSRCSAIELDDTAAKLPDLWGALSLHKGSLYQRALGLQKGSLYQRQQDGRTVYSTRELPGSHRVLEFTVKTPSGAQTHPGLGDVGRPQLDAFAAQFRASAEATGVDDAWLRAIAHAESGFDRFAQSPKGAQGLMQLMPATAERYGVSDPFASGQSILAGAQHLKYLMKLYDHDLSLVAAAYNAGVGALKRYGGIPPYAETKAYVAKVLALHARYREALALHANARGKPAVN